MHSKTHGVVWVLLACLMVVAAIASVAVGFRVSSDRIAESSHQVPLGGHSSDLRELREALRTVIRGAEEPIRAQPSPAPTEAPAAPAQMDDAAIEAEVAKRAKPADIKFDIATKMAMGQVYEAKLEILRPGGERGTLIRGTPEINERVQILNKARATISSAHLKIERLLPEWQEIPSGGRGFWTWKVEPQKPGKAELVVLIEHAATSTTGSTSLTLNSSPRSLRSTSASGKAFRRRSSEYRPR
jgi:hypothetical protein